ncbi:MAG: radical SAM protein [Bacteroidales bacterium]|nr:radical SAM protein [Bacteroidales bacterium]
MLREETVFGPIRSRRLGRSLGINLLPQKGKICNFDCIYCECGWNKDGKDDQSLPTALDVRRALEDKLAELMLEDVKIDSITFSGDGEPTLHPEFDRIVEDVIKLRDAFYPNAKISVLTNATRLNDEKVVQALKKVDNPILKLDAATLAGVQSINRPTFPYDLEQVLSGMEQFDGEFILQTMFLRTADFDSTAPDMLELWMEAVRRIQPREIQCYSIDRPTPEKEIEKISADQIRKAVKPLMEEGFVMSIY